MDNSVNFGIVLSCLLMLLPIGCDNRPVQSPIQRQERELATFRGIASYDDGSPAPEAVVSITSLVSGRQVSIVAADHLGRFEAALDAGEYALAITAERGFGWIESARVPNLNAKFTLSRECRAIEGSTTPNGPGIRVNLARKSPFTGDVFVSNARGSGSFKLCLPEAYYSTFLSGTAVSRVRDVNLSTPATSHASMRLAMDGFTTKAVEQAPQSSAQVLADVDGLVADIVAKDARLIGLGEATHGTAEFVSTRGALTLDLIRRAGVRLVMFEFDAVIAAALDDYVIGLDVDLGKAVAALGFWISDTEEFLRFLRDLRAHNATIHDKVRVWGVDLQNTEAPVEVLLAVAVNLGLTADDQAMLKQVAEKRGKPVREFSKERRAVLDALLARLAKPRGTSRSDLRIAVAARSLTVQMSYLDGDRPGLYGLRRDAGMASLASFLLTQVGASRACLWAHAGHIARESEGGQPSMGQHLAAVVANRYYPVGFYVFQGSARAWDAVGKVGVVTQPIPAAAAYMLEGAIMAATRWPEIAWVPISRFSPALHTWSKTPRYVRELGARYVDEENLMTLRYIQTAFDAIVVIKTGRDSTPTPTGVRKGSG